MKTLRRIALGLALITATVPRALADAPLDKVLKDFVSGGHNWEALKARCGPIKEINRSPEVLEGTKVTYYTYQCAGLKFINVERILYSIEISSKNYALPGNLRIGRSTEADVRAFLGQEDSDAQASTYNSETSEFPGAFYYHANGTLGVDTVRFDFDRRKRIKRVTWSYYVE